MVTCDAAARNHPIPGGNVSVQAQTVQELLLPGDLMKMDVVFTTSNDTAAASYQYRVFKVRPRVCVRRWRRCRHCRRCRCNCHCAHTRVDAGVATPQLPVIPGAPCGEVNATNTPKCILASPCGVANTMIPVNDWASYDRGALCRVVVHVALTCCSRNRVCACVWECVCVVACGWAASVVKVEVGELEQNQEYSFVVLVRHSNGTMAAYPGTRGTPTYSRGPLVAGVASAHPFLLHFRGCIAVACRTLRADCVVRLSVSPACQRLCARSGPGRVQQDDHHHRGELRCGIHRPCRLHRVGQEQTEPPHARLPREEAAGEEGGHGPGRCPHWSRSCRYAECECIHWRPRRSSRLSLLLVIVAELLLLRPLLAAAPPGCCCCTAPC
jgi:hypothetical protein